MKDMIMQYDVLCEQILKTILLEGIDKYFLNKMNNDVGYILKGYKSTERKQKLKERSKDLIVHILNGNYTNILNKYFPNLIKIAGKIPDSEFKGRLDQEFANQNISADQYKQMLKDIDSIIYMLGSRNNQEHKYLMYLRTGYLMGFGG